MDYVLSQHASEVAAERQIAPVWIQSALEYPDLITTDSFDEDIDHYFKRVHEYEDRVLRVVINKKANPIRIVTVYFDRTMKGRL